MLTNFRLVYFNGHLGSDLNLLAWSNFKYSYLFSTSRDCCTTLLHPIRVLHPLHLHSRHHCTSSLHPRGKNCQIKIYYFQFIILDLVRFPNLPTPSLTLPDSYLYCHVPLFKLLHLPGDTCPCLLPGRGTKSKSITCNKFDNAVNDAIHLLDQLLDPVRPAPHPPEAGVSSCQGTNQQSFMYIVFNFLVQISLFMCMIMITISMTMSVNVYMKSYNGNIKTPYFDLLHQNLPGTLSVESLQIQLELIVRRYHPAVLVVSEASTAKLQHVHLDSYVWIRGKLKDNFDTRISMYVQSCLPVEELDISCDIPTVAISMGSYSILGVYREWSHVGDQDTRAIQLQLQRSLTLAPLVQSLRGKLLCIGDFNFCLKYTSSNYQMNLNPIRDLYFSMFQSSGWHQWMDKVTRAQKGSTSGLLDHVYSRNCHVDRTYNKNITSTDHNLVGVRVILRKPLFQPQSYRKRDIHKVDEESFARAFLNCHIVEVFAEEDPTRALSILEWKIT